MIATFMLALVAMVATMHHREPQSCIKKEVGGSMGVSEFAGVYRTRVTNWKHPKEQAGADGAIPFKHVPAPCEAAKVKGMRLTTNDFSHQVILIHPPVWMEGPWHEDRTALWLSTSSQCH